VDKHAHIASGYSTQEGIIKAAR